MKKFLLLFFILVLAGIGGFFYFRQQKDEVSKNISTFLQCEAAGFPVQESYPPVCRTPDGRSFAQDIGNELEYVDLIQVDYPRPNSTIESPLTISGKARGTWFFEANFSAELRDDGDKLLGAAIMTAKSDWMTEEFVSFEGVLEFAKPATSYGKLFIKNANPSGLTENDKELVIPLQF